MGREVWTVEVESVWTSCKWYTLLPQYVSEDVARLAVRYVWASMFDKTYCRVRRVA